ncbi:MAG TPA: DUF3352 domain-containing protein [Anaerolineae bacterium]
METLEPAPAKRSNRLILGIVGGVIVVALIAAGVLIIPRLLNTAASTPNLTAAAMPADTQIYLAFHPRYDQLPNGGAIRKAWSDPAIFKPLEDNIRRSLFASDLDWDQDIAPWLGDEIGLGFSNLPLGFPAPNVSPPVYVVAVLTRDTTKSDAFLAKVRADTESHGVEFREQTYRDVATVEQVGPNPNAGTAYATLKNMVILANGPDWLHAAIDALLDGKGLDTQTRFASTLNPLRGGRAATLYLDVAAVIKPVLEQAAQTPSPSAFDPSTFDTQTFGMGLTFEPNGIILEFLSTGDPSVKLPVEEKTGQKAEPNPNRLLRAVPDSTFVYLSGRRLSDALADILKLMQTTNPMALDMLADFERQTGIDLTSDFNWASGEAAFAMLPGSGLLGGPGASPFGFALILEASDKQAAEASFGKMFGALVEQSNGVLSIEDVTVGDYPLHGLLDRFSGEPTLVYGLMDDRLVAAFPEAAAQKIANAGDRPLADDEDFKAAIAPLPDNTIGYAYFKPKTLIDLIALGLSASGQSCQACALFQPVQSLAFTIEYPPIEPGTVHSMLFMRLDVGEE